MLSAQRQLIKEMEDLGYEPNKEPASERVLAEAIACGLPDRCFTQTGAGRNLRYCLETSETELAARLGRESVLNSLAENLYVWGIYQTHSGDLYVNNAVHLPKGS